MDGWAIVAVASSEPEAELLCSVLRGSGIECVPRLTNSGAGAGDGLGTVGAHDILVSPQDAQDAREILHARAQPNRLGSARPSELTTDSVNEVSTAEGTRPPSVQVHAVSTNDVPGVAMRSSDDAGDSAPAALAESLGPRLGAAAAFATTEHFNLQTARAITVSEANGRASAYLAALSTNLIALAFIGQMSRLGTAFYAFALILLPVLAFVGVVTFIRLVQSSIEDIAYAHRIGRLRDFYLRLSPELAPYVVVVPGSDRSAASSGTERLAPSAWQLTLTAAGMVAVVNSVVVGACAGLVLTAAGVNSLALPLACGAVIGAGAFSLHERHHRRASDAYSPEAVDLAAISVPPSHQADAN